MSQGWQVFFCCSWWHQRVVECWSHTDGSTHNQEEKEEDKEEDNEEDKEEEKEEDDNDNEEEDDNDNEEEEKEVASKSPRVLVEYRWLHSEPLTAD